MPWSRGVCVRKRAMTQYMLISHVALFMGGQLFKAMFPLLCIYGLISSYPPSNTCKKCLLQLNNPMVIFYCEASINNLLLICIEQVTIEHLHLKFPTIHNTRPIFANNYNCMIPCDTVRYVRADPSQRCYTHTQHPGL